MVNFRDQKISRAECNSITKKGIYSFIKQLIRIRTRKGCMIKNDYDMLFQFMTNKIKTCFVQYEVQYEVLIELFHYLQDCKRL